MQRTSHDKIIQSTKMAYVGFQEQLNALYGNSKDKVW